MSIGIDELFDMLSWNSDEETQRKGVELAQNIKCFSVFLQPYGLEHSKDIWENCAKIIASYSDETLQYCLQESFSLLLGQNRIYGHRSFFQYEQNPHVIKVYYTICL